MAMVKVGQVIKKRPRIRLRVPRTVTPGETFVAEIRLHAKREVDIEFADVLVVGTEGWYHGEARAHREVCRLGARASEQRTLAKGPNVLSVRCTIPDQAPPSYTGTAAYVRYRVDVHVKLAWWPDARASFEIQVRAASEPTATGKGVPRIYTTNTSGPRGTDPHVEVSLATDAVTPGGEILGNITLYNVQQNPYRDVLLTLIARERLLRANGNQAGHADSRFTSRLAIEPRYDGESHAFRLKVPESARVPTRRHRLWQLEWLFEIEARARKSAVLRFPIRMLSEVEPPQGGMRLAAPTIGQQRVAAHWETVAQRRGLTFAHMSLRQTLEHLDIEIVREHRGDEGTFLIARFKYPPLGLELEGGLRRGLRRLLVGVQLGDKEFDDAHYLTGRDERQVGSFLIPLLARLEPFTLERVDDAGLELAREGSGHSEQALDHFVLDVQAAAEAWVEARRNMPAPGTMRDARESWQRLAQRFEDSRFDAGDMSIHGKLDGAPLEIVTDWHGTKPRLTRITLEPTDPIDEDQVFEHDGERWVVGRADDLSGEARALVERLLETVRYASADRERLFVELDAPQLDAQPLLQLVRTLATLAALLRTQTGPYR